MERNLQDIVDAIMMEEVKSWGESKAGESMNSAHISKVEKARNYAEDKGRMTVISLTGNFRGNHNSYQVSYDDGQWYCSCSSFTTHDYCSHSMALQRMLQEMTPITIAVPAA